MLPNLIFIFQKHLLLLACMHSPNKPLKCDIQKHNTSHTPLYQLSKDDLVQAPNTPLELNFLTTDTYATLSFRCYIINTNLNGVTEYPIGTCIKMPTVTSSSLPSIIPLTFKFSCSSATMHSNLFLNSSIDQNIPLSSFIIIQSTCATFPWNILKKFSSIIGQTCSDVFHCDDPATLIEYYLPIQEYILGIHLPEVSAHACDDI